MQLLTQTSIILEVWDAILNSIAVLRPSITFFPALPQDNDTHFIWSFQDSLRTLYPKNVPARATRYQFFTVGLGTRLCDNATLMNCTTGFATAGHVKNRTWVDPHSMSVLQAYNHDIKGIYTTDFPDFPWCSYDYASPKSAPQAELLTDPGTRVSVIEYGMVVDLVLQGVNNIFFQNHPFHLHGHNFWVLGHGTGNYDPESSPSTFNYYDPPFRFTVDVPARGWVAIRRKANNPGVWFFHSHMERHTTWGMQMTYIVLNGHGPDQTLLPPPERLTPCLPKN